MCGRSVHKRHLPSTACVCQSASPAHCRQSMLPTCWCGDEPGTAVHVRMMLDTDVALHAVCIWMCRDKRVWSHWQGSRFRTQATYRTSSVSWSASRTPLPQLRLQARGFLTINGASQATSASLQVTSVDSSPEQVSAFSSQRLWQYAVTVTGSGSIERDPDSASHHAPAAACCQWNGLELTMVQCDTTLQEYREDIL